MSLMKKILMIFVCLLMLLTVSAQEKKFSPERYNAELDKFITQEAALTPQEAAKLLPLLHEMHERQRVIYGKMRKLDKEAPTDEKTCADLIKQYDKMNLELRHIEHGYHKKMMLEASALKVYSVIKAENRFHRRMMKGWQKGRRH